MHRSRNRNKEGCDRGTHPCLGSILRGKEEKKTEQSNKRKKGIDKKGKKRGSGRSVFYLGRGRRRSNSEGGSFPGGGGQHCFKNKECQEESTYSKRVGCQDKIRKKGSN